MSIPILPLAEWFEGLNQASIPANDNANRVEILSGLVISKAVTAQPTGVEGATYILAATHTGAQWSTFDEDDLTIYKGGTWHAFAPVDGVVVNFDGHQEQFSGSSGWGAVGGGAGGLIAGADKQIQYNNAGAFGAEAGFEYDQSTNTFSAPKAVLSAALNEAKGSDIASAGTTDIGAATGNLVHVTGTTTITALGTVQAGTRRIVVFDGALTLTHNATSLILPTGASITTAAGDAAVCVSEGSGNWRVTAYQRKDGTALVVGGASLVNWTEAANTSAPNATVPVVSFAAANAATNVDAALKPKGAGALTAHIADSTATGGNKRGANAVDWQSTRTAAAKVASGPQSVIGGGVDNVASSTVSTVAGGNTNTASGNTSTVGGGETNTASGTKSTVAGGATNVASAFGASIMGGASNTASTGDYAAVAGGSNNAASGFYAIVTGGTSNVASGDYSRAGGNAGTTRGIRNADVYGTGATNSQRGVYTVRRATTDATPAVLTSSGVAATTALIVTMPDTTVFAFSALVAAKRTAGTDGAGWKIEGVVIRGAGAGTVAFVGTPTVTSLGATAGAAAWAAAAVVDTTNGGFTIQATGQAATTISWLASISTAET